MPVPAHQARTQSPPGQARGLLAHRGDSREAAPAPCRTRWPRQPLEAALLQLLIARGMSLAAGGCEQAEGEDEHDGQQNCGCYPEPSRELCDGCRRLRGDHVGEIEHVAQRPAHICASNLCRQTGKRDGKGCKVPGKLEKSLHPQVLLHNHHFCAHLGLQRPQQ